MKETQRSDVERFPRVIFSYRDHVMVTRADFALPPLAAIGDGNADGVFLNVGYALSQWEHAEDVLASIYSFLCGPKSTHAAFRSYGTLTATMPRRNIIQAASEVFFLTFPSNTLPKRLSNLLTIYTDAGARRNEIAHGVVMGGPSPGATGGQWFLVPALHSTKKTSLQLQAEYRFNSSIIDGFAKAFNGLQVDIIAFRADLIEHYESFPDEVKAQYA